MMYEPELILNCSTSERIVEEEVIYKKGLQHLKLYWYVSIVSIQFSQFTALQKELI